MSEKLVLGFFFLPSGAAPLPRKFFSGGHFFPNSQYRILFLAPYTTGIRSLLFTGESILPSPAGG